MNLHLDNDNKATMFLCKQIVFFFCPTQGPAVRLRVPSLYFAAANTMHHAGGGVDFGPYLVDDRRGDAIQWGKGGNGKVSSIAREPRSTPTPLRAVFKSSEVNGGQARKWGRLRWHKIPSSIAQLDAIEISLVKLWKFLISLLCHRFGKPVSDLPIL